MKRLFLNLLLIFFLYSTAWGATYYAGPTGSGTACTSGSPCALYYAIETKATDGDTIIVNDGTYTGADFGTSDYQIDVSTANLTIQAANAHQAILDGEDTYPVDPYRDGGGTKNQTRLVIVTASGVTWDGIDITGSTGCGILFGEAADNGKIDNSNIYLNDQLGAGVQGAWADRNEDTVIEDSLFYGNGTCEVDSSPDTGCPDFPAQVNIKLTEGFIFRRNIVRDGYHESVDLGVGTNNSLIEDNTIYGHAYGLYLVSCTNATIRRNLIYGMTTNAYGQTGLHVGGIRIHNEAQWPDKGYCDYNLSCKHRIYDNYIAGNYQNIVIQGMTNGYTTVEDMYIFNNTFVEATAYNIDFYDVDGNSGSYFYNNIIQQSATGTIARVFSGQVTADYNLWSREPDTDIKGTNDPSYLDPQLAYTGDWTDLTAGSLSADDFKLLVGSPAIDAGSYLTEVNDTGATTDDCDVDDSTFFYGDENITIGTDEVTLDAVVSDNIQWSTGNITFADNDDVFYGWNIPVDIGADQYAGPIQNHCPVCTIDTPTGDDVVADGTDVNFTATCTDADGDDMTYTWYDNGVSCGTSEDLGNYGDTEWDDDSTHVMTLVANDGQCNSETNANNTRTIEVGTPASTTVTFGKNSTNTYQGSHVDNSIWEGGATQNNGTRTYMYIGPSASSDADEGLLAFDLSGATGLTASACKVCVTIYDPPSSAHTLTLYANQDAWTETGSNWNTYDGTNAWTGTRGQDGSKATVSSGTTDEAEVCFEHADLLTYVNASDDGMCRFSITGSVNDDKVQLHTRESTDGKRPYLQFTYEEPSGVDLAECWFESDGPFKQGDTVNAWVKYPIGSEISFTTDGDGTPEIEFETGASDIVLTLQTTSGTAQNAHLFSGTVGAGENSSDLTPTGAGINLEGWTASDAATVTWPAEGLRFQDNNDCVIDTTVIDFSAGTFFHCDSDMAQINVETTYEAGDTCYLCLQSNSSQDIYYEDGPLGNLKIDTDLTYPAANSEWEFCALADDIIQFSRTIAAGDRSTDLQAAGTAEGTGFIHGATTISDLVGNTTVYTLPQTEPDGGNIVIAGADTFYLAASDADATTHTNLITAIGHSVPGDGIYFHKGETFTEKITIASSGTSGSHITFGAYGTGADPIIDATGETQALYIAGKSYLDFSDIVFKNSTSSAVYITTYEADASYITFTDCEGNTSGGDGFLVWSRYQDTANSADHITFTRCTATENDKDGFGANAYIDINNVTYTNCTADANNQDEDIYQGFSVCGKHDESIADNGWTQVGVTDTYWQAQTVSQMPDRVYHDDDNVELTNNADHENLAENEFDYDSGNIYVNIGEDVNGQDIMVFYGHPDTITYTRCTAKNTKTSAAHGDGVGIFLDWGTQNGTVEKCDINNNEGRGVVTKFSKNSTITRNLIYDNGQDADNLTAGVYCNESAYNVGIYNNTIVDNQEYGIAGYAACDEIDIKNNIISGHSTGGIADVGNDCTNDAEDFNQLNNTTDRVNMATGSDSQTGDPLFRDSADNDYKLKPGSPCKDAGTDVGLTTDYVDHPVPRGSAPDIGAYEYRESIINRIFPVIY